MIINIPIESIPFRYSIDWAKWTNDCFKNQVDYMTIIGKALTNGIEQGRFLDCIGTNYYKSSQLQEILSLISEGYIQKNSVLFFHDLWFPGIEQIKYTSDLMDLNLKITGCLHAGAYDPNDMLYQKGLGSWAVHFEHMLFALSDLIFVATQYHKDLIQKSRSLDISKVKDTGFPIHPTSGLTSINCFLKKNNIVFPHRLDPEKNPHVFEELQTVIPSEYNDWNFISTVQQNFKTKKEYYSLLEKSKIAVSFSDQETWGIAMQEAVFAGCLPLVPNKLSYKEMYLDVFKYNTFFDFQRKLTKMINDPLAYVKPLSEQQHIFYCRGSEAIPNMLTEIKNLEGTNVC